MDEWVPIVVAIVGSVGAVVTGIAAWRKADKEAGKLSAEATTVIVGSAEDVVKLVREQLSEMSQRERIRDERLLTLEQQVGTWEGWAERVLDILDRALDLLSESHRATLEPDVREVKAARPLRHPRKHIIHRPDGPHDHTGTPS